MGVWKLIIVPFLLTVPVNKCWQRTLPNAAEEQVRTGENIVAKPEGQPSSRRELSSRLFLRYCFALAGKLKSTVQASPDTRSRGEVRTWPNHSSILEEKIHANFPESLLAIQIHCMCFWVLSASLRPCRCPLEPIDIWELLKT